MGHQPFPSKLANKFTKPFFVASGSTSMIFTASLVVQMYHDCPLPYDGKRFAVKIPFSESSRTIYPMAQMVYRDDPGR